MKRLLDISAAAIGLTAVAHALFAFGNGPILMGWHVFIAAFLAGLALCVATFRWQERGSR